MAKTTFKNDVEVTGTLTVGGATVPAGTQAAQIADVTVTGTYADDDDAIETAINSIIAALEAFGITASS